MTVKLLRQFFLLVPLLCCTPNPGQSGLAVTVPSDYYASASNACQLVNPADLRAVLAREYRSGKGGFYADFVIYPGITTCLYEQSGGRGGPLATGVVYAYSEQVLRERQRKWPSARTIQPESLPGIGEEAFWDVQVSQLLVLDSGKLFVLVVRNEALEPMKDTVTRARRLAAIALRRMKS